MKKIKLQHIREEFSNIIHLTMGKQSSAIFLKTSSNPSNLSLGYNLKSCVCFEMYLIDIFTTIN